MKTPNQGAQNTLHCALAPNIEGGKYYSDCVKKENTNILITDENALRLWQIGEELVRVEEEE